MVSGPAGGGGTRLQGMLYLPTELKVTVPVPTKLKATSCEPAGAWADKSTVVITSDWSAVSATVRAGTPSTEIVNAPTAPEVPLLAAKSSARKVQMVAWVDPKLPFGSLCAARNLMAPSTVATAPPRKRSACVARAAPVTPR